MFTERTEGFHWGTLQRPQGIHPAWPDTLWWLQEYLRGIRTSSLWGHPGLRRS